MRSHNLQKGFTLIELIIVIVILSILAVGLMASLNPIEKINQGRDMARINMVKTYVDAMSRFYAINGKLAFNNVATSTYGLPTTTAGAAGFANGINVTTAPFNTSIAALVTAKEISQQAQTNLYKNANDLRLWVADDANATPSYLVCTRLYSTGIAKSSTNLSGAPGTIPASYTTAPTYTGTCIPSGTVACYFCDRQAL